MAYLKVKDHNHFLRDVNTNSIINNNMTDYQEYISRRDNKNQENEKIQNLDHCLITTEAISGPFRYLRNSWHIKQLEKGSEINFSIDFSIFEITKILSYILLYK
jgi:ribosome-associated toxin RatA of RatAB toxin-antitoxin module